MRTTVLLIAFCFLAASAAFALPEVNTTYAKCTDTDEYRITTKKFGSSEMITLISPYLRVSLLTTGATLLSVEYCLQRPEQKPQWVDVALGFDHPDEFYNDTAYMGRVVGRFAGRIARGEFKLDGKLHRLNKNENGNTLHGGAKGFSFYNWNATLLYSPDHVGVRFEIVSPNGDQGFPGELHTTTTYTLPRNQPGELKWRFEAELTAEDLSFNATVVNLCNHVYWNLNGIPRSKLDKARHIPAPVTNHNMLLRSKYLLLTDDQNLPWGDMRGVVDTPHDFREMRPLKEGIDATAKEGRKPAGYDDPVVIDDADGSLRKAAMLVSPETNIQMEISTTSPGIVMYTLNHMPKKASGEYGDRFQRHSGIALETQYFPNSPHVPEFPSTVLRRGTRYDETTVCNFATLEHTK